MRKNIHIFANDFFHNLFFTYILLFLLEMFKNGVVTNFLNMDYILIVVVICGLAAVFTEEKKKRLYIAHMSESDFGNVFIIGLLAGLIVYAKTKDFGPISIAISVITAAFVFIFSLMILGEASGDRRLFTMEILGNNLPLPESVLKMLVLLDSIDRLTFYKILQSLHVGQKHQKPPKL